jgi:hypothetical protein
MTANLKLVGKEPSLEEQISLALTMHRQAVEALRWAEEELLPLRRSYARERGEFMLPTIERLRREVGE